MPDAVPASGRVRYLNGYGHVNTVGRIGTTFGIGWEREGVWGGVVVVGAGSGGGHWGIMGTSGLVKYIINKQWEAKFIYIFIII